MTEITTDKMMTPLEKTTACVERAWTQMFCSGVRLDMRYEYAAPEFKGSFTEYYASLGATLLAAFKKHAADMREEGDITEDGRVAYPNEEVHWDIDLDIENLLHDVIPILSSAHSDHHGRIIEASGIVKLFVEMVAKGEL